MGDSRAAEIQRQQAGARADTRARGEGRRRYGAAGAVTGLYLKGNSVPATPQCLRTRRDPNAACHGQLNTGPIRPSVAQLTPQWHLTRGHEHHFACRPGAAVSQLQLGKADPGRTPTGAQTGHIQRFRTWLRCESFRQYNDIAGGVEHYG